MSTKIHNAWRIPRKFLERFIKFAYPLCHKECAKKFYELTVRLHDADKIREVTYEKYKIEQGKELKPELIWMVMMENMEGIAHKFAEANRWNRFGVDCHFDIRLHGRFAYIIPFMDHDILAKLKENLPSYAQDFRYFNNADKPSDISVKEWRHRRTTWEKIGLKSDIEWSATRLVYTVVKGFETYSFIELSMAAEKLYLEGLKDAPEKTT